MKFCSDHIKHPYRHPPNHLFLLASGVHTTASLRTSQDITDLSEIETRIFLHWPPKPCGPNPFWLNSWLSCSFYKHTYTFPPVTSRHSHYEHVWTVREFILILLHKMDTKFENMVVVIKWKVFWKPKWGFISQFHFWLRRIISVRLFIINRESESYR